MKIVVVQSARLGQINEISWEAMRSAPGLLARLAAANIEIQGGIGFLTVHHSNRRANANR